MVGKKEKVQTEEEGIREGTKKRDPSAKQTVEPCLKEVGENQRQQPTNKGGQQRQFLGKQWKIMRVVKDHTKLGGETQLMNITKNFQVLGKDRGESRNLQTEDGRSSVLTLQPPGDA